MSDLRDEKQLSTEELLDAQTHLWNHIFCFINSMSLKCAIELGIPDIIHKHDNPITLSELNKALNINKSKSLFVGHLMRVLVHAKFFTKVKISRKDDEDDNEDEDEDEENNMGFTLTPAYRPLLIRDNDLSMASFIASALDSCSINAWQRLSGWFENDAPTPFWNFHGKTLWDYLGQDPSLSLFFNESMANDSRLLSRIVPKDCKQVFEGLGLMVDVGGGTGYMAKVISDEFPALKCIVLDLPQVVDGCKGDDKVTFIGGNMFESIPPCDAVFLKWILHDWNDEGCLKILKKCKEAIKDKLGGKVIIIDMVVGDDDRHKAMETQLFFDMTMMVLFCGKERTEKDWAKLFSEAGFTTYKIYPLLGLRSLIEVFP